MGKLTIVMAMFNVAFCMFTRPGKASAANQPQGGPRWDPIGQGAKGRKSPKRPFPARSSQLHPAGGDGRPPHLVGHFFVGAFHRVPKRGVYP